ncbi:FAD-dependent oxidoreductase [Marinactinospora thermotolerans]|uniref:Electron transfer flavoprotein-quinone oxidoreductase n=1 Tax=Marinactinospora thermotolerans DSM 45154 TaxID=1122192 RepID=A0A1T4RPV5_9ACTN|nr:FAD-dependent oxidoreductase [Marinactinospora thermotolerans]SKA18004.1 electron transfer flavoprotein-quinone oxidoreductase [Marinactinospora thermotolerans DSM 45154]
MTRFDVVVVGAGPAGSAAALAAARTGASVLLVERGPFPGAKNMHGGVIHGGVLERLIPRWWERAPVQRWVTRRTTMVMTGTQSLSLDFRSAGWTRPPYNGATAYRSEFDSWLAGEAERAGARLVCSTTVTGLLRAPDGTVRGVTTDREGGDIEAGVVIACDGVNSLLTGEAGLSAARDPGNFALGAKEVLALSREEIDERFGLSGREGAEIEMLGCTAGIPGGAFLHTYLDTVAVGVVVSVDGLSASGVRPEELIARVKAHPSIAPYLRGAELKEYSAHLAPQGGYDALARLAGPGLLVCGDAAGLCLAAGPWLEGVNFAIGSGMAAGEVAARSVRAGDVSTAALAAYRNRLEASFVLSDHRRWREVPRLLRSQAVHEKYPRLVCDAAERVLTVPAPRPRKGLSSILRETAAANGTRLRDLVRDGWQILRSFT